MGEHFTQIGGTDYAISGGNTCINGTTYSIAQGETYINGTIYNISFSQPVTITLTGYGDADMCYISYPGIGGTKKYESGSFSANVGETIYCYCNTNSPITRNVIYLNGTKVAESGPGSGPAYYLWEITGPATISFSMPIGLTKIEITTT